MSYQLPGTKINLLDGVSLSIREKRCHMFLDYIPMIGHEDQLSIAFCSCNWISKAALLIFLLFLAVLDWYLDAVVVENLLFCRSYVFSFLLYPFTSFYVLVSYGIYSQLDFHLWLFGYSWLQGWANQLQAPFVFKNTMMMVIQINLLKY